MDTDEIVDCPTEADFYHHWQAVVGPADDPIILASRGGASADRLAWVFMSGYQAALRRCFPEYVSAGWLCFAAAEPRDGPSCTLLETGGGYQLSGQKSWIAGAAHVEGLVCSLNEASQFLRLERNRPGIEISLPRSPSFLAELTQGVAEFSGVEVSRNEILDDPGRARLFRGAEPLFVLSALNAFLASHARALDRTGSIFGRTEAALELAVKLSNELSDRPAIKAGLNSMREMTRKSMAEFSDDVLPGSGDVLQASWQADGRLMQMFGVSDPSQVPS